MTLSAQQFNKLATKDDLKDLEAGLKKDLSSKKDFNRLSAYAIENREMIKDIKQKMATKDDINKVLTAVDGVAKKLTNIEAELVSNQMAHDRFEGRLKKLEKDVIVLKRTAGVKA